MKCNIIEFWIEKVKTTLIFFELYESHKKGILFYNGTNYKKNTKVFYRSPINGTVLSKAIISLCAG